jgi:3-oxoacyl-[acyl-carrier protein] reductase
MKLKDVEIHVTGASRGLGRAISQRFIDDGAHVTATARAYSLGVYRMDVRDLVKPWAFAAYKTDVLVCNAGIYGPVGPFETNAIEQWRDTIETNLMGVVNCCHEFLPQMKERKSGKIIIISGGGATKARPNFSAYATSKAAVLRFMECLSEELKPWNIDVNCLAPGALNTSIHDAVISAGPEKAGVAAYRHAQLVKETPPDFKKACDLAVWLASQESNGITGKLISIHHDYRSLTA